MHLGNHLLFGCLTLVVACGSTLGAGTGKVAPVVSPPAGVERPPARWVDAQPAGPTCALPVGHAPEGDHRYYALPGANHGLKQSPINILTNDTVGAHTHLVALSIPAHGLSSVENTGHSVQLNFPEGGHLRFDDRDYELLQAHFHTPSEHQVDGVTYPMEMHVVARAPARVELGHSSPDYVVLSVLFKMGRPNPFVDEFIGRLPVEPGAVTSLPPDTVYLNDCFEAQATRHYYHYKGSLTTPPYTESVDWLVLQQVVEASRDQVARWPHLIRGHNT